MKIACFDPHRDAAEFRIAMRAYPQIEFAVATSQDALGAAVRDAQILLTSNRIYTSEPAAIIRASANALKWIQFTTSGLDKAFASGFPPGVTVTNMAGLRAFAVAEHALTLMLQLMRRTRDSEAAFRARHWARDELSPQLDNLAGKHLTVFGIGAIGQDIARKAKAFDMRVTGISRKPAPLPNFDDVRAREDLLQVCKDTDILVIAALADASTAGVIDATVFDALPTRAFVVNIARGSLIDEPALIAALRAHSIAGAALDVQEIEPVPADHPLWSLENLVLTPHTAGAGSNGTGATHAGRFTANLDRWLAGKPLEQVVIERT